MLISKKIRTKLGQHRFLKEVKRIERRPEIINFDEAAKIGILYDATDERDSDSVKNYVKSIRTNYKKDILAMGYVDQITSGLYCFIKRRPALMPANFQLIQRSGRAIQPK